MPYLNLDDKFAEHPKVDKLSDAAFRLHVSGLLYCAAHTTDGRMTEDRPARLVRKLKPAALAELLEDGIWETTEDGYEIRDYLQWNKSKAWWDAKRKKDAERQAQWRAEHGKEAQ